MNRDPDRRQFMAASVAAGASLAISAGATTLFTGEARAEDSAESARRLKIQPRYHRWHVDPGVEWVETNTTYATLDWSIPLSQAAVVLIDVWDRHYLLDTQARTEAIIKDRLAPLLDACREAGLLVIHAPSSVVAQQHPNWKPRQPVAPVSRPPSDWPPPAFRSKSGEFRAYARPAEPREPELVELRSRLQMHALAQPVGDEPVIGTGDELHSLCREKGILFLLFAGFNTNACILMRDYGTLAMSQRGYEVVLIRDCTTGMESRDSHPQLAQTNGAILLLEMFGQYSITSEEIIRGLPAQESRA